MVGGEGSRNRAETHSPASAVGQPTAAVDVELSEMGSRSLLTHTGIVYMERECVCEGGILNPVWLRPNRTEALTVTDKRQAPSVKSTRHQASFGLADAKSMTEALAGGQTGGRPLLAPSSAGLKIQRRASSIRESLFMMMMTISLCLHSLFYLNPSLSCLLLSFPPLSLSLTQFFFSLVLSESLFQTMYL